MTTGAPIKTDCLENQSCLITKLPKSKNVPMIIMGVCLSLLVLFGSYKIIGSFLDQDRMRLAPNLVLTMGTPRTDGGVAIVDLKLRNLNAVNVGGIVLSYRFVDDQGNDLVAGESFLAQDIAAGDERSFKDVNLGLVGDPIGKLKLDISGVRRTSEYTLTPALETKFAAAVKQPVEARIPALQEIVAHNKFAPALLALGEAMKSSGDLNGAEDAFNSAVALKPEEATYHLRLAEVLSAEGNNQKATTELKAAQGLDPDDSEVLTVLQGMKQPAI